MHFECWAKLNPRKSLILHMRESGIVAAELLTHSCFAMIADSLAYFLNIDENEAISLCCYLSAIHDIGKCHPAFQEKDVETKGALGEANLKYPFPCDDYRHEIGSGSAIKRIWEKKGIFSNRRTRKQLSYTIVLHHQGKSGRDYPLENDRWKASSSWLNMQDEIEQVFFDEYRPASIDISKCRHVDCACMLLNAIVIISDWIASGLTFETTTDEDSNSELHRLARAFLANAGLDKSVLPWFSSFTELWPFISKESERPLQKSLEDYLEEKPEMPLLSIIEAPMGEGKTEAGLYTAFRMAEFWNKSGLYIALPTSATANQMLNRVGSLFETHGIGGLRLIHSLSWLDDKKLFSDNSNSDGSSWLASSKKSLLAPYGVGTIDQAMMASMRVKYGVLRLLGLAGKVLVVDEIHAYDVYMSTIINRLLQWCRDLRIPVVLMSATLPLDKKKELIRIYSSQNDVLSSYQMLSFAYIDGSVEQVKIKDCSQRKSIEIDFEKSDDMNELILDRASYMYSLGGCVAVIVNTVQKAQEIYALLESRIGSNSCMLFHSAFTVGRREKIEKDCLSLFGKDKSKRPKGMVLVATQVVEQSLDLDFDYMITEIAPIDLILQRVGRLHRHDGTVRPSQLKTPKVLVVRPNSDDYGSTEVIYYKALLNRTSEILENKGCIELPNDIPEMVEYVYQQHSIKDDESEVFFEKLFDEQMKSGYAQSVELRAPDSEIFTLASDSKSVFYEDDDNSWVAAKTRLSEETVRFAILPQELYDRIVELIDSKKPIPYNLARASYRFSASISKRKFKIYLNPNIPVGTGLLKSIYLYKNDYPVHCTDQDNLVSTCDGKQIVVDSRRGVLLSEKPLGTVDNA